MRLWFYLLSVFVFFEADATFFDEKAAQETSMLPPDYVFPMLRGVSFDPLRYYTKDFDDDGHVTKLFFNDHCFDNEINFEEYESFKRVEGFYFKNCNFSSTSFNEVLEMMSNNCDHIRFVGFSYISFKSSEFTNLMNLLVKCPCLEAVRFVNNGLSKDDIQKLSFVLKAKKMKKIVLEENLSDQSTKTLIEILKDQTDLEHLSISWGRQWNYLALNEKLCVTPGCFVNFITCLHALKLKVLKLKCQGLYDSFDFNSIAPYLVAYLRSTIAQTYLVQFSFLTSTQNHFPYKDQAITYLSFNEMASQGILEALSPELRIIKLSWLCFNERTSSVVNQILSKNKVEYLKLKGVRSDVPFFDGNHINKYVM